MKEYVQRRSTNDENEIPVITVPSGVSTRDHCQHSSSATDSLTQQLSDCSLNVRQQSTRPSASESINAANCLQNGRNSVASKQQIPGSLKPFIGSYPEYPAERPGEHDRQKNCLVSGRKTVAAVLQPSLACLRDDIAEPDNKPGMTSENWLYHDGTMYFLSYRRYR